MSETKYAIFQGHGTSNRGHSLKVYEVEVNKKATGSLPQAATIVKPVAGVYFSIPGGKKEHFRDEDIFDTKKEALKAAQIRIFTKDPYDYGTHEKEIGKAMASFFDRVFTGKASHLDLENIDKMYRRIKKALKNA